MQNPFLYIVPSEHEQIVDRDVELAELHLAINKFINGGVIVVKGPPGIGKTSLVKYALNSLKKENNIRTAYFELNAATLERLNELAFDNRYKYIIAIDDINNEDGFTELQKNRLRNLISVVSEHACLILVENREEGIEKCVTCIQENKIQIIELKGLSFADIKQIIINRLNLIRRVASDSIEPFQEKDIETAYKKAEGNPRMILLILAAIFDRINEEQTR